MSDLTPALAHSAAGCARELIRGAAAASWRGPDPYDGLLTRWPAPLRGGPRRRQAIIQLHARAPFDLRRLYLRRGQPRIAKALALFGQAALRLEAAAAVDERSAHGDVRAAGRQALALLADDRAAGEAWGYPFDVQTRWSFYPAGAPNVIVTAFAGSALAEADALPAAERPADADSYRERARGAARWTLEHTFNPQQGVFTYHAHSDAVIHNANLLAAKLVWRLLGEDPQARAAVTRALERTLAAQRADGTWGYGEGPGLGWCDSFHTGFVLGALVELRTLDGAAQEALARGARAYAERFFGPGGEARLWLDKRYPEDAHAAGTGLSTLVALQRLGLVDRSLVARVARRVTGELVRGGHAIWRRGRWGRTHVSYIRWCDAHVALGLADVVGLESDAERP